MTDQAQSATSLKHVGGDTLTDAACQALRRGISAACDLTEAPCSATAKNLSEDFAAGDAATAGHGSRGHSAA